MHFGLRCVSDVSPIMHMSVSDVSQLVQIIYVGLDQACRSPTKHVSVRWFSDQACRSSMGYVGL